jgi:hypothetical protein
MRISVVAAAICLSIFTMSAGTKADAATRQATNIAAQELAPALQTLARERDIQVVYRSELVGEHRTGGATGNLTFEEALTQLLNGTGLTYRYLAERAITIVAIPPANSGSSSAKKGDRTTPNPAAEGGASKSSSP